MEIKYDTEKLDKILSIAIKVLIVVFAIIVLFLLFAIKDDIRTGYDASYFHDDVVNSRYYEMLYAHAYNIEIDKKTTKELEEYYAVAGYFEAASLYKAYGIYGDEELVNFYEDKMNDFEKSMGSLASVKQDINKQLNLE